MNKYLFYILFALQSSFAAIDFNFTTKYAYSISKNNLYIIKKQINDTSNDYSHSHYTLPPSHSHESQYASYNEIKNFLDTSNNIKFKVFHSYDSLTKTCSFKELALDTNIISVNFEYHFRHSRFGTSLLASILFSSSVWELAAAIEVPLSISQGHYNWQVPNYTGIITSVLTFPVIYLLSPPTISQTIYLKMIP